MPFARFVCGGEHICAGNVVTQQRRPDIRFPAGYDSTVFDPEAQTEGS
jgi:hypothetical protein